MAELPERTGGSAARTDDTVGFGQLGLAGLLGIVCFSVTNTLARGAGEGVVWFVWFASMAMAAAGLAFFARRGIAFGGAAVIVLVQPVAMFVFSAVIGEIARPSSSTGGMVGVCIGSVLILLGSPLVFAGAGVGLALGKLRRRGR